MEDYGVQQRPTLMILLMNPVRMAIGASATRIVSKAQPRVSMLQETVMNKARMSWHI